MTIPEVQIVRKIVLGIAIGLGALLLAFTNSSHGTGSKLSGAIKWSGVAGIVFCIHGRTWCSLYIGGRKVHQFVTAGPYSISRNPLYFFSILGAAGVGAQLGSAVSACTFGLLSWLVFYVVVLQEERVMAERYGAEFGSYKASVPQFLPNLRLWRDSAMLVVVPANVMRTLADSMFFLLAVPLAGWLEYLKSVGTLPVFMHLP